MLLDRIIGTVCHPHNRTTHCWRG